MSSPATDVPTPEPTAPKVSVAALLFVLAALWVAPLAYGGYKMWAARTPEAASQAGEDKEADKAKLDAEKALLAAADVNKPTHVVLLACGAFGAIAGLVGGFWSTASRGTIAPAAQVGQDRKLLLLVGGFSGLLLMALGVWFVVDEYELLANWLSRKETKVKDLWRVLAPALVFIAGTGLAFLSAQPARQEERHDQTARRLVYGTNFLVTVMLLFVALVVLNGFVAFRVPNRLDTTQTGNYSLSPSTINYVRTLADKVTVYSIAGSDRPGGAETEAILTACEELNPSRFVVRKISASTGPQEIQKFKAKFSSADLGTTALIVALGDDEKRYSVIRENQMVRQAQPDNPEDRGPPQVFYEGEAALVRELLFLTEGKDKSTVYFTQGSGELSIESGGPRRPLPDRSALELKNFLEKANVQVRPLPFDAKAGTLPDDASVIVVADPTLPLGKELVAALQKFMTDPGANGKKKGKLIVLAGPHPTPKMDGVQPTGLEELLKGFNVQLVPTFLFNQPTEQLPPELVICLTNPDLQTSGNPVARSLPAAARGGIYALNNPRALEILPNGNPAIQTTALIETIGGRDTFTWQEDLPQRDTEATYKQLAAMAKANQRDTVAKKKMTPEPLPLAVVATEGPTPRLVVVGAGEFFADATNARLRDNPAPKLIASGIDWLRDRPVVEVTNKQFGFYTPPLKMDRMRLLFLPFGLLVLATAGLAAGVWVIRRK